MPYGQQQIICPFLQAIRKANPCIWSAAYLEMHTHAQLGNAGSVREHKGMVGGAVRKTPQIWDIVQGQLPQAGKALQVPLLMSKGDHGTEFSQPRHIPQARNLKARICSVSVW